MFPFSENYWRVPNKQVMQEKEEMGYESKETGKKTKADQDGSSDPTYNLGRDWEFISPVSSEDPGRDFTQKMSIKKERARLKVFYMCFVPSGCSLHR